MSEFHVEVGAYALDALDEGERAAFEQHLAGCEDCRLELAEFTETAARLGALSETAPPPELRASVLGAIAEVRPLPPASTASDMASDRGAAPTGGGAASGAPAPDELAERRLRRRSRLLTLAVAAAMVVALALGGWTYVLHRDQQVAAAQAAAATRLLSAPDVRTYPVTVAGTPATFVVSKSLDQAMFVGASLPAAGAGRTYQLWTLDAGKKATPDVVFPGGTDTREFMTGNIAGAAALAISAEPAGGSSQPTDVLGGASLRS